jgi:hypothetical protein
MNSHLWLVVFGTCFFHSFENLQNYFENGPKNKNL